MNELKVIEGVKAPELFGVKGEVEKLLAKVEKEARSIVPDLSSAKGRKAVASNAMRVSKSKTYLDGLGKTLVSDWKAKAKLVDGERKTIRDRLDALRDEVRKPLTDWEQAETERVADIGRRIEEISVLIEDDMLNPASSEVIYTRLEKARAIEVDATFGEFTAQADHAKENAIRILEQSYEVRKAQEEQAAELERLRAEKEAARLKKEEEDRAEQQRLRDERIAEEAIKREREEAAREQAAAQEREEAAQKMREMKAAADLARIEREKQQAIQAQADAERKAKESQERAAQEAAQAVEQERLRVQRQEEQERAAAVAREADKAHRARINNIAMAAFVGLTMVSEKEAKSIVAAIAKGQIPHISIRY